MIMKVKDLSNKNSKNENINIKNNEVLSKEIHKEKCIPSKKLTKFNSTKWVVFTTVNPPKIYLKYLLRIPEPWKIVVIGDKKTNNTKWNIFKNSKKLIYLSVKNQMKLCYNTTKFIPFNSYSRKNIGYLYAIQHGAKVIYDTDDDIYLFNKFFLDKFDEKYTYYAENNNSIMINPYSFYGKPTMWPRGFRLKDIEKSVETKFYRFFSYRTELNHLIYQGVLNMEPDVDSIYRHTRIIKNYRTKEIFFFSGYLMYLPGNFIPINSKNTRFKYDVFPCLPLPKSIPRRIVDIWRGYIIQRYSWIYNSTLIYHNAGGDNMRNSKNENLNFINDKDLYFKLDNLLEALNIDVAPNINHPIEFLFNLIEILIDKGILLKEDLDIYKAFIEDLNSFGYKYNLNFNKKIETNEKKFLNFYSDLHFYFTKQNKFNLQNNNGKNIKVFRHKAVNKKYNDILLIINYNYIFLTKLNNYMLKLYHEYFPHMIFVYPGIIENNETYISCPESHMGYYSYKCVKRVYEKYPNKKGYLFLMDDNFLKVWELENFDFNIPWFYHFLLKILILLD